MAGGRDGQWLLVDRDRLIDVRKGVVERAGTRTRRRWCRGRIAEHRIGSHTRRGCIEGSVGLTVDVAHVGWSDRRDGVAVDAGWCRRSHGDQALDDADGAGDIGEAVIRCNRIGARSGRHSPEGTGHGVRRRAGRAGDRRRRSLTIDETSVRRCDGRRSGAVDDPCRARRCDVDVLPFHRHRASDVRERVVTTHRSCARSCCSCRDSAGCGVCGCAGRGRRQDRWVCTVDPTRVGGRRHRNRRVAVGPHMARGSDGDDSRLDYDSTRCVREPVVVRDGPGAVRCGVHRRCIARGVDGVARRLDREDRLRLTVDHVGEREANGWYRRTVEDRRAQRRDGDVPLHDRDGATDVAKRIVGRNGVDTRCRRRGTHVGRVRIRRAADCVRHDAGVLTVDEAVIRRRDRRRV